MNLNKTITVLIGALMVLLCYIIITFGVVAIVVVGNHILFGVELDIIVYFIADLTSSIGMLCIFGAFLFGIHISSQLYDENINRLQEK